MERNNVGIVGLGTMGMPIATRLMGGAFQVYGYDLQQGRVDSFASAGGSPVESLPGFPEECNIFFLLLPFERGRVRYQRSQAVG